MKIEWFKRLPSLTCAASGNSSTVFSRVGVPRRVKRIALQLTKNFLLLRTGKA